MSLLILVHREHTIACSLCSPEYVTSEAECDKIVDTGFCRFIVELQPNSPAQTAESICKSLEIEGTSCSHIYYRVFKGFSAHVRPALITFTPPLTLLSSAQVSRANSTKQTVHSH